MREADHLRPPESVLVLATANEAAGQLNIRGRDAKADSIGKVGFDRSWMVCMAIIDAHGDGQEGRRGG